MTVRNLLLVVLVLVNMLLITAVVLQLDSPRSAEAQVVGGGYNYAFVSASVTSGEDALWVLDLRSRKLHALRLPTGNDLTMTIVGTRDLVRDFRGTRTR